MANKLYFNKYFPMKSSSFPIFKRNWGNVCVCVYTHMYVKINKKIGTKEKWDRKWRWNKGWNGITLITNVYAIQSYAFKKYGIHLAYFFILKSYFLFDLCQYIKLVIYEPSEVDKVF